MLSPWENTVFKRTGKTRCMIKIFQGDRGGDTFKPPYEQLLPLPTPCFKMFWKDSLMTPPHFKHPSLLPPSPHSPSTSPPPLENFDHTQSCEQDYPILITHAANFFAHASGCFVQRNPAVILTWSAIFILRTPFQVCFN